MMKKVYQALRDADAVLAIVDCSTEPQETLQSFNMIFENKASQDLPLAVVSILMLQDGQERITLSEANGQ